MSSTSGGAESDPQKIDTVHAVIDDNQYATQRRRLAVS